jgi:hypothetical protein
VPTVSCVFWLWEFQSVERAKKAGKKKAKYYKNNISRIKQNGAEKKWTFPAF